MTRKTTPATFLVTGTLVMNEDGTKVTSVPGLELTGEQIRDGLMWGWAEFTCETCNEVSAHCLHLRGFVPSERAYTWDADSQRWA